jgi:RNA polymerase sigma-70 factor, ECF subfamily
MLRIPMSESSDSKRRREFHAEAMPHLNAVYSMALRIARNPDDASDLMQETMMRAFRAFDQFERGTNCRAWLLTILYNNFRNGYRKNIREQVSVSEEEFAAKVDTASLEVDPATSDPEALAFAGVMAPQVTSALDALPEEFRIALVLIDVDELNYHEASEVLEVPVGTVKSRVSRGRAMMRAQLREFAKERGIAKS